jgi:hypothetical protein
VASGESVQDLFLDPHVDQVLREQLAVANRRRQAVQANLTGLERRHTANLADTQTLRERADSAETALGESQGELSACQEELERTRTEIGALCEQNSALVADAQSRKEEDELEEALSCQATQMQATQQDLKKALKRVERCDVCIRRLHASGSVPRPLGPDRQPLSWPAALGALLDYGTYIDPSPASSSASTAAAPSPTPALAQQGSSNTTLRGVQMSPAAGHPVVVSPITVESLRGNAHPTHLLLTP